MKSTILFAGLCLWSVQSEACPNVSENITLNEALSKHIIQLTVRGSGTSSGSCLHAQIKNLKTKAFDVVVPAGTVFQASDPDYQDIVITKEEIFALNSEEEKYGSLYGFCCEAYNATPTIEITFDYDDSPNPNLQQIAQYINENNIRDLDLQQSAIWSVSDGFPLAGVYDELNTHADLRRVCADIIGEEEPWYNIEYGDILDRPFTDEPLILEGDLEFRVKRTIRAALVLIDPDGEELVRFFENREMPPAMYTQQFSFESTVMKRGEYHFQILVNGKVFEEKSIIL